MSIKQALVHAGCGLLVAVVLWGLTAAAGIDFPVDTFAATWVLYTVVVFFYYRRGGRQR